MADLLVQRRACRLGHDLAEQREQIELAERERTASAPQSEQLTRTPGPTLLKGKGMEPSFQIIKS